MKANASQLASLQAWWNRRFALVTAVVVILALAALVGFVAVLVVTTGRLHRVAEANRALEQRIEKLDSQLADLEQAMPEPAASAAEPMTTQPAERPAAHAASRPVEPAIDMVTTQPAEPSPATAPANPVASSRPTTRQWLERHVAEHPEHLAGQLLLASMEMDQGQLEQALSRLQQATQMHPDAPSAWDEFGVACFRSGQNQRAAEAFEKAIELDDSFAAAKKHLGILRWNEHQPIKAIELLDQAVTLAPADDEAQYALAVCRALMGAREEAVQALRSAVRLNAGWLEKARSEPAFSGLLTEPDWAKVQS